MRYKFYFGRKLPLILVFLFTLFTVQISFSQSWCIPATTNIANYGVGVSNMTFWNAGTATTGTQL